MSEEKRPRTVTIFGAGVAGLTVAHELAERGFAVTVIDPAIREERTPRTLDRGIGGMARSQYAATHPLCRGATSEEGIRRLSSVDKFLCNDVIRFDERTQTPVDDVFAKDVVRRAAELILEFREVAAGSDAPDSWQDEIRIVLPNGQSNPWRREWILDALVEALGPLGSELRKEIESWFQLDLDEAAARRQGAAGEALATWGYFSVQRLAFYPGEHGFRFFPSFYRHLYDTMGRTPLLMRRPHESAMSTTRDNLVPSEGLGFARAGKAKSFMIERRRIDSIESARKYIILLLRELDYTLEDIQRIGVRLLEYMTSSTERREREYESLSWGKFVKQDSYSKVAREHIEYGPAMSAALRGSQSDARTQGNISLQLVMDQFRVDGRPDCTLNAPTNPAWLNHWHEYLCQQKVVFRRGSLDGFTLKGKKILPRVSGAVVPETEFYVLALSLPSAVKASEQMLALPGARALLGDDNDFDRTLAFGLGSSTRLDDDIRRGGPSGPLQHLSGIQFYFDVEMGFWRGHTQYLDSEWGLTSISQPQFWGRRRLGSDPYRGILSVDIGIWNRPFKGKTAWECTPDEIADRAWAQIVDHHDDAFRARFGQNQRIPTPIAYAIDANLRFFEGKGVSEDTTPFLVNRTGAYPRRPGKVMSRPRASKEISVYEVWNKQWVMAGTFMKTFTRLTSMEGANESARHAANAILNVARVEGDRASIWDPEDCELPELQYLRDLDALRVEEGRSHLVKALGVDALVDSSFA